MALFARSTSMVEMVVVVCGFGGRLESSSLSCARECDEPKAPINGSTTWSPPACWVTPRAGISSACSWGFSDVRQSFRSGDRSILSCGEHAGSRRPDAKTLIFGAGGHEHFLPSIEVNGFSRTNRTPGRMAQMEQTARLAMFHQKQQPRSCPTTSTNCPRCSQSGAAGFCISIWNDIGFGIETGSV